jgi:hypothetical protein
MKYGEIGQRLWMLASRPEGVGLHEVEGLTPMQVSQNGTRMPGAITIGYRKQRRIFTDPAHARVYEEALPILRKELKAQRNAMYAQIARERKAAEPKPPKPPKPAKQPKVKAAKPAKAIKAKTAPNNPKKPAWSKDEPSVKFGKPTAGIHIPKYTGPKWDANAPAIIPPHVKVQVIPSPPEFGPAAKLRGIGA